MRVDAGTTSVISYIKLVDPSDGTPETSLTITNLDVNYIRDGANPVESNATEHANLNDVYSASKMKEVGTAIPGLYRVDWPDGAFVSGVDKVQLAVEGAAVDPAIIECEIGPRQSNLIEIGGVVQSATDLKDFADDGYDPGTNKVQGVVLVDTTTVNSDLVTASAIKTAIEADGGDLSSIMEALVNKMIITEANGNAEMFNDAGASQGSVASAFTSVAGETIRLRMFK